ncbi:unnamed protein product [Mytilus edulis]|uniref:Uncharacterized protein n=1 Tax=Mytilus edulis TaxID=6550 RepID=A0A8S3SAA6_MYTED|nr:unnamed protein product [Mytilus edulis]
MAEEPNALLSKLTDQFDLDKVKTIAPDEGHPDNDWLVIFWQDLHFGVVNIDSTYDGENVELKSGQPLSFGDKMHALYGPELLKAIFITRGQNDDKEVKSDSETLDDNLKVKKKAKKRKKEEKSANETLDDNLKVKKKVIREENKKKAELRGKVAYEKAKSMFSEIRNVHDQPQSNKQPEVVLPNKVCLASQNATNTQTELEASNLNNLLVHSNPTFNIQSNFNPSMQTNQLHRPVSSYPYHQNSMFNQCNNIDSFAYNFQSSYFSFRTYWQNSSHILSNPYQGNTFSNLHHPQPMRPTSTCSLYNPFKIMHEIENQSDQSLTNMNESTNTSEIDASVSPDSDSDIEDPVNLHSNSALSTTTTKENIKVLTIQLANAKQDIENMKLDIDSNNGADENLQMPPGYQYLVEGSPLAVKQIGIKPPYIVLKER